MSLAQAEELPQAFEPKIYVPPRLKGIVDFIGEATLDRPGRALIMPSGKVEIAFFLEGSDVAEFYMGQDSSADRGVRKETSLIFSVANRPQIVAGRQIHVLLALMSPAAAMLFFGIPASVFANRSVDPREVGVDVRPLEDVLRALPSFEMRSRALEAWLVNRLGAIADLPDFMSFRGVLVDLFLDGRAVPLVDQVMDLTGYSRAHANRLSRQWTGLSLEKTLALRRYREALRLVNSPMPLADVAAAAGYFDQAHFTHRFTEYSGISPSKYRETPRTGADTLHLA